ncbi:hypothetical protein EGW08_017177, partial [Elysia chlorotica]
MPVSKRPASWRHASSVPSSRSTSPDGLSRVTPTTLARGYANPEATPLHSSSSSRPPPRVPRPFSAMTVSQAQPSSLLRSAGGKFHHQHQALLPSSSPSVPLSSSARSSPELDGRVEAGRDAGSVRTNCHMLRCSQMSDASLGLEASMEGGLDIAKSHRLRSPQMSVASLGPDGGMEGGRDVSLSKLRSPPSSPMSLSVNRHMLLRPVSVSSILRAPSAIGLQQQQQQQQHQSKQQQLQQLSSPPPPQRHSYIPPCPTPESVDDPSGLPRAPPASPAFTWSSPSSKRRPRRARRNLASRSQLLYAIRVSVLLMAVTGLIMVRAVSLLGYAIVAYYKAVCKATLFLT